MFHAVVHARRRRCDTVYTLRRDREVRRRRFTRRRADSEADQSVRARRTVAFCLDSSTHRAGRRNNHRGRSRNHQGRSVRGPENCHPEQSATECTAVAGGVNTTAGVDRLAE
ncbi:hypothetical protein D3C87_1568660 [compost metagenome]